MMRRLAAAALGLLPLGCSLAPPPPAGPRPLQAERVAVADAGMPAAPDAWWTTLPDPVLAELIAQALRQNPTLHAARARVQQAAAALELADAQRAPQLNADASVDREHETATGMIPPPLRGATISNGRASLSASYDLDLFGRLAAGSAAGSASVAAARADTAYAAALLATATAQAYVAWRADLARRTLAQQVAELRGQLQQLARLRQERGLDAGTPRRQTEADRALSRSNVAALELQLGLDRDALAALVVTRPEALPAVAPGLPPMEIPEPRDIELGMLARRADVVAARWRVESAVQNLEAARLQFYPSVNLSALVGLSSVQLGRLLRAESRTWNVGPAVHLPIFDGGRLRANARSSQAQLDAAVAAYDQAVIGAAQEVLDQVQLLRGLRAQLVENEATTAATERIGTITERRAAAGLADRAGVLQSRLAVLSLTDQRLLLQARIAAARITLARASGAGIGDEALRLLETPRTE